MRTNHGTDTGCDLNGIKKGGGGSQTHPAGGRTSGEVLFCQMDDKLINPLQCLQSRMTLVTAVGGDTLISATAESLSLSPSLLFSWPFYIVTANEVRARNARTEGASRFRPACSWPLMWISGKDVFWLWSNSGLVFQAGSKPLWSVSQRVIKYQRKHYCGNSTWQEVLKEALVFFLKNLITIRDVCSMCVISTDVNFAKFPCAEKRSGSQWAQKSVIMKWQVMNGIEICDAKRTVFHFNH